MNTESNEADRRGYFRLKDRITLEYNPLGRSCTTTDPYSDELGVPPHIKLLSELHKLEHESSHFLHSVMEHNRAVGNYLKILNKRIDCLSKFIANDRFGAPPKPTHEVSLSEGGLAFDSEKALPLEEFAHIKIVLFPSLTNIAAIGKITHCQQQQLTAENTAYRIGVEFEHITDSDRQQLAKHIIQEQSRMRRKKQGLPT